MVSLVKSYFLPPNWRYKPGGSIFLRSVISNAKAPQDSLNSDTVAAALPPQITLDQAQKNFRATIDVGKYQDAGVHASFLSMFGLGGDLAAQKGKQHVYKLEAQELRTQEINPNAEDIDSSLQSPAAVKYLEDTKFREDLYVVVGLMVGLGVTVSTYESSEKGFRAHLGVSGAPAGVALELGPKYSASSNEFLTASFDTDSATILGYSLKRITYMKKTMTFKNTPVTKGAVLGTDRPVPKTDDDEADAYAKFVSLDSDDIGAEEFDLPSVAATEETVGLQFEFVIPR